MTCSTKMCIKEGLILLCPDPSPRDRGRQGAGAALPMPYLLQVAQDIGPAVENALPLGGVEVVQELRGVVIVAFLVSGEEEGA